MTSGSSSVADFALWILLVVLVVGFVALTYGGDLLTAGAAAVSDEYENCANRGRANSGVDRNLDA